MTNAELETIIDRLIQDGESECVEFKTASDDYNTSEIGKYFSALSNEANFRGLASAWLVFGVDNKGRIVGTDYRREKERRLQERNHKRS